MSGFTVTGSELAMLTPKRHYRQRLLVYKGTPLIVQNGQPAISGVLFKERDEVLVEGQCDVRRRQTVHRDR